MDSHTLDILEFDKVRRILSGFAATSLGRQLAVQLVPMTDAAVIQAELNLAAEMMEELGSGRGPSFGGLRDVRLTVRRAAIGTALNAEQLLEVADALSCTGVAYRYRSQLDERHTGLIELLASVEDLGGVARTIQGCIDARAHILDMASHELTIVRQKLFDLEERVKAEVRRLLRDPELRRILSYPNATVHGEHYVLPVAVNHRHKVAGVVHRFSGTGETVYIEPATIAGLSAERMTLKAEEDREVKRILRRLSSDVGRCAKSLLHSLDIIAKFDFITAKAKYASEYKMMVPRINDRRQLWLRSARHPILEHLFRQVESPDRPCVVPIDVRLGMGFNMLVITGPNTGGKTVTLKTTGLLVLMAHAGLPIPADGGSTVPFLRQVLADIGDEQSLEQSLSTFSSHITRIAAIFHTATLESLILLDELGAGTDPVEGAALGRAILDELDGVGGLAMVTTHLGDLKTYALKNDRAENAAVEFDIETMRPTYRLLIGQFGMSNALMIAKRLRLPRPLLLRARDYLKRSRRRGGRLLSQQRQRLKGEAEQAATLEAQHQAHREEQEREREQARKQRATELEATLYQRRLTLRPQDRVHVARFDAIGTIVKVDPKKQTALVSVGFGQWEVPLAELAPLD